MATPKSICVTLVALITFCSVHAQYLTRFEHFTIRDGLSNPLCRGATGSGADIEEGTLFVDPSPNLATWNGITELTDFALFSWPAACVGDFDSNGTINTADMLLLLAQFGCSSGCTLDLTGNDIIDTADLLEFLTAFGTDCP